MSIGLKFEEFIEKLLSNIGLKVIDRRVKIKINEVEVGEIDILAIDENNIKYAIEVKAGKIDVNGVRQAYVNAQLINAKPLIICRGFSNESAKQLAEKLNVNVITLDEVYVMPIEELKTVIEDTIYKTIDEILTSIINLTTLNINDNILNAFMKCNDFKCFCNEIELSVDECSKVLMSIRNTLNIKSTSYTKIKTLMKMLYVVRKVFNIR